MGHVLESYIHKGGRAFRTCDSRGTRSDSKGASRILTGIAFRSRVVKSDFCVRATVSARESRFSGLYCRRLSSGERGGGAFRAGDSRGSRSDSKGASRIPTGIASRSRVVKSDFCVRATVSGRESPFRTVVEISRRTKPRLGHAFRSRLWRPFFPVVVRHTNRSIFCLVAENGREFPISGVWSKLTAGLSQKSRPASAPS